MHARNDRPQHRSGPRLSRRHALGLSAGAGYAALLAACGGTTDESTTAVQEATREAGVIAGGQGSADETPKPGGSLTFHWPLTPPLDPFANTTYTTQRLAAFVYPRLLKFKTDKDPKTAQH